VNTLVAPEQAPHLFSIFGVECQYKLDRDELERAYLQLSQQHHPDRFSAADTRTQRVAMERSSLINAAYRILRDPVRRAEYLVKLGGIDLDSTDPETGAPHPDQAFLIEMIEQRERLADAKATGSAGLEAFRDEATEHADTTLDEAIDALQEGDIRLAARHLVTHRYLRRLLEEAEDET